MRQCQYPSSVLDLELVEESPKRNQHWRPVYSYRLRVGPFLNFNERRRRQEWLPRLRCAVVFVGWWAETKTTTNSKANKAERTPNWFFCSCTSASSEPAAQALFAKRSKTGANRKFEFWVDRVDSIMSQSLKPSSHQPHNPTTTASARHLPDRISKTTNRIVMLTEPWQHSRMIVNDC